MLAAPQNDGVRNSLILFSTAMFTAPLLVLVAAYYAFSFLKIFELEENVWLAAGGCAIVTVNLVLAAFSVVTYREEKERWEAKMEEGRKAKAK